MTTAETLEEAKRKKKKRKKVQYAFAPFFGAVGAPSGATYPRYRPLIYDKSLAGEYTSPTVSEPGGMLGPIGGVGSLAIGMSECVICEDTKEFQGMDCPACNSKHESYEVQGDGVIVNKRIDTRTFDDKVKKLKTNTVINDSKNKKRYEIFTDANQLFHLFALASSKDPRYGIIPSQSSITQIGVFKSLAGAKEFVNSAVN